MIAFKVTVEKNRECGPQTDLALCYISYKESYMLYIESERKSNGARSVS